MAISQVTANAFGSTRTDLGVWKDAASSTVGAGLRATSTQNNITLNYTSGVQGTFTPTLIKASIETAKIEVKSTSPSGVFSGYFKAEALTASVHAGIEGNLLGRGEKVTDQGGAKSSSSGVAVASVGAEAHIAKTTVGGTINLGPIKVDLSGSVGVGAAASATAEVSNKSIGGSVTAGAGFTLGGSIKVSWDTGAADKAIQKATIPAPQPTYNSGSARRTAD